MRYIHQHPQWPAFHWDDAKLLPILSGVRLRQGRLLGQMEGLGFRFRAEAGLENLTAEVIKSSAIEGTVFDPEAVRSSVARRMGLPTTSEVTAGRDVDGAVEMLIDATQNYDQPLTTDRLLGWQSALFPAGRSGMKRILVGEWRTPDMDPMQVISGPLSRDHVRPKNIHFEAPSAKRLPDEVAQFLKWFEASDTTDAVLRAGLAHLWFVTIHPFEDGNGRVSRAIADMALARAEGTGLRFYSMSTQIEAQKKQYYDILERTQKGTLDVTDWLVWFFACLDSAIAGAHASLSRIIQKSSTWERINGALQVGERQKFVLNALLDGSNPELSTSRYAKLAKCSLDTALRDMKQLVEAGILEPGPSGGRSTTYHLR
ncbi:Fic family protein [Oleiharenicola lentus]|uniref:Fic family protein n=1 Tax=Oleiharenicola lentus TaxID=2508720 RepID=UPI003F665A1C